MNLKTIYFLCSVNTAPTWIRTAKRLHSGRQMIYHHGDMVWCNTILQNARKTCDDTFFHCKPLLKRYTIKLNFATSGKARIWKGLDLFFAIANNENLPASRVRPSVQFNCDTQDAPHHSRAPYLDYILYAVELKKLWDLTAARQVQR